MRELIILNESDKKLIEEIRQIINENARNSIVIMSDKIYSRLCELNYLVIGEYESVCYEIELKRHGASFF